VATEEILQQLQHISVEDLLKHAPEFKLPDLGSLVEGKVVDIIGNKILVDLGGVTGLIAGKEARDSTDTVHTLQVNDVVYASVVELENSEGMVVLSLRRASKERTWKRFIKAYENREVVLVKATEANKGGLLLEVDGIKGFIPVSQLAPLHYPRVNGADSGQILSRLEKLVGMNFDVRIISIDHENGKLILSEKAAQDEKRRQILKKLKVGQKVSGHVSGVVKFGIFVAFDGLEGLVHISEIAWGHVKDPSDYARLGDEVDVIVIGIDGEKISLSMKRLVPDPWADVSKTYPIGAMVDGEITRVTPYGVFLKLTDDINGLIHTSEVDEEHQKDLHKIFRTGQKVKAKVISIDLEEHKIGLSFKSEEKVKVQTEVAEADGQNDKNVKEKSLSKSKIDKKSDGLTEFLKEKGFTHKVIDLIISAGYNSVEELRTLSKDDFMKMEGVGQKTAEKLVSAVASPE